MVPEPPARGFGGWARDVAAWGVKGAIAVPEAAVGLMDIPTGGRVGKFLENEGGAVGFRPKQAKEMVNDWHSDATKEAQRKFQEAEGIGGKFQAAIENPSNIVGAVVESLPSMGAGGVVGRGLMGATRLGQMGAKGAAVAGAAGEGTMMAGSQASEIRQETEDGLLTPGQAGAALATGGIGGAFGFMGGRLANKLGIGDADTMMAQGTKGIAKQNAAEAAAAAANPLAQQAAKGIPRQVVEGAISEGFLEELPQSMAETIIKNLALDKPWTEGLDEAIVMGVLSGGAMGGAAAGYKGMTAPKAQKDENPNAPAPTADAGAPAGEPQAPAGPGTQRMRNAFAEQLAAERAAGAPAPVLNEDTLMANGIPPQARINQDQMGKWLGEPQRPSEAMGLRTAEQGGGGLENAAALAVNSGASPAAQPQQYIDPADAPSMGSDTPLTAAASVAQPSAPAADPYAGYEVDYESLSEVEKALYDWEMAQAQMPDEALASLQALDDNDIPFFDQSSNTTDEDFLRALGASDEEINDAIATTNQPRGAQGSAAGASQTQANDAGSTGARAGQGQSTSQVGGGDSTTMPNGIRRGVQSPTNQTAEQSAAYDGWLRSIDAVQDGTVYEDPATGETYTARVTQPGVDKRGKSRGKGVSLLDADGAPAFVLASNGEAGKDAGYFGASINGLNGPAWTVSKQPTNQTGPSAATQGAQRNGAQTPQAQQASTQQPAAGAAAGQAVNRVPAATAAQAAGTAAKQGAVNGPTTTENNGGQAGTPQAPQGQETRESRAQRVSDAGQQWTRMTAAEREATVARTQGVKSVIAKNLPRAKWEDLHVDMQRKLADAISPAADKDGEKARWIQATLDKSRLNGPTGVQIDVAPNGGIVFKGDPNSSKDARALKANYDEAIKAGATPAEIAAALMAERDAKRAAFQQSLKKPTPENVVQAGQTSPAGAKPAARLSAWDEAAQDDNAAALGRVQALVDSGRMSLDEANATVERAIRASTIARDKGIVADYLGEAVARKTGEAYDYASTIEQFEGLDGMSLKDARAEHAKRMAARDAQTNAPAIEAAAAQAATSPTNDTPAPTEAQKEAGNYKKGHVRLHGLEISIENPAGTQRNPGWPALKNHYGYFKGSVGADKDHVDVFLTDKAEDASLPVFVVDQSNKDGSFDEHKVIMGAATEAEARATYLANYEKGWTGLGAITEMSLEDFKAWVMDASKTKKPAATKTAETATPDKAVYEGATENRGAPEQPPVQAERSEYPFGKLEAATSTAGKQTDQQAMAVGDDFPMAEAINSYSGISHSGLSRAEGDKQAFDKFMKGAEAAGDALAETDAQRDVLNEAVKQLRADYLAQYRNLMNVRAGTYSGFVAGRGNLNSQQADSRNNALDKAMERFDSWVSDNADRLRKAVLDARTPEQLKSDQDALAAQIQEKADKKAAALKATLLKFLSFKSGDNMPYGKSAIITRVSYDKDGYPSSLNFKMADGSPVTDDKLDLVSVLKDKDETTAQAKVRIRTLVDEVRAENPELTKGAGAIRASASAKAEKPAIAPAPVTYLDRHNAIEDGISAGTLTLDDYKAAFADLEANRDQVIAELNKLTKDELLRAGGSMFAYQMRAENKAAIVQAAYSRMLRTYALGREYGPKFYTFGAGLAEKHEADKANALRELVANTTADDLDARAAEIKAARDEYKAEREAKAQALANPKSLQDFRGFMRHWVDNGDTAESAYLRLTPEQRQSYDALEAEQTKDSREAAKRSAKVSVASAGNTTAGEVIATKHTKHGHDLFVVQLAERVERDAYETLNNSAKRLGGSYSSYRGNGAIPGFQFRTREAAEAFQKLVSGDTAQAQQLAEQRRDAFDDDKSQTAAERLRTMADALDERATEALDADRKVNTARRARFAASADAAARAQQALAGTMRNIAQAIDSGTAKFLDGVRQRVQVEYLMGQLRTAKSNQLQAKYPDYGERMKRQGEPIDAETVDFAQFPRFEMFRSDLAGLARQLLEIEGGKKMGAALEKLADDVSEAYISWAKENLLRVSHFGNKADGGFAEFASKDVAERAIKRAGLVGKAVVLPIKRGQNRVILSPGEAMQRGLWQGDGDKRIRLDMEFVEQLAQLGKRKGSKVLALPWQLESALENRQRLQRMGIQTPAEFRSALRELASLQQEKATPDRIKELERSMVGRANDGLDFFPTSPAVVQSMLDAAEISEGMAVLEPSAGMGHIADAIVAETGVWPDVVEISGQRRELLEAKGLHLAEVNDFMNMEPRTFFTYGDTFRAPDGKEGVMRGQGGMGSQRVRLEDAAGNSIGYYDRSELVGIAQNGTQSGYDRIVMNPPFSNGRDIQHVQHAYNLLKPGGRIVAIMGEGAFFQSNKRAESFRNWLDERGATNEKLPDGSFMDPSLPVNTGVAARMVVIDKPVGDLQLAPRYGENADNYPDSDQGTDSGDVRFSRVTKARGQSMAAAQVQQVVDAMRAAWANGPEVVVAFDMQDPAIPAEVRAADLRQRSGGAVGEPEGFYYKGKVYVLASQMRNANDVARVVAHEVLGHYGLRGMFGKDLGRILDQLATMRRAEVAAKIKEYGLSDDAKGRREAAEEVLSVMAQTTPKQGFVTRAVAAIRTWLRANVPGFQSLRVSDAEIIRDYILPARAWVERGGPDGNGPRGGQRIEPAMSRAEAASATDQTQTANFKRWFGDSKVVDADGKPLVVYHGTASEFTVFSHGRSGFFFTDDHDAAQAYADHNEDGDGDPRVIGAYLSLKNPLILDKDWYLENVLEENGDTNWEAVDMAVADAEDAGHDGLILRGFPDFAGMEDRPGMAPLRIEREYDQYIAFNANQIKSATGNNGDFDPANPDIRFSRAKMAEVKSKAVDLADKFMRHPGRVSLWDKTVGTMRHLAERAPAFKPVFEAAQQFLDDVSNFANEAANMAPRLLPRIETLGDMLGKNRKAPISASDNQAIGKALFGGTLDWGRDQHGKAMPIDALREKYRGLDVHQKAEVLLAAGKIDPQVLAMWRGKELAQFESLINSKFDSNITKAGVRFSHEELRKFFQLTDAQISLYDEARAAVDKSLDITARAEMLRRLGKDWDYLRGMVMDAPTLTEAWKLMDDELEQHAKQYPDQRDYIATLMHQIEASRAKAAELMRDGYMPLQRFGKYTLLVRDKSGENLYFGMFESMADSNAMLARMRKEYPDAKVIQGTMSEQRYKLFAGITPETAEMFGSMLGLDEKGKEARDVAFQEFLKLAKNNHSALKRLIHRKGTDGYSDDVGRVLASFIYSNSRLAASGMNAGRMDDAINRIDKEEGELNDVAVKLRSYIQDPQEEGQAVRGMLFAQYLGGSLASAAVNMSQPFTVTLPWMTQYGGMANASRLLAAATADMSKRVTQKGYQYEADLAAALKSAEDDGTVSPQEIHQLMAQARGAGGMKVGDGTKAGDARAKLANTWEKVKVGWGYPFALAEQFNRRLTFIAAFRLAKQRGMDSPAEFARKAVLETQFLYSKANKPHWARGAIGGTLFTFKTYSVSYLELMQRMWTQGGPEGKRAVGWAMLMLLLVGGAGGLPFMEDAEDLIDGAGQMMGYNVSTKHWRQEATRELLGAELAKFLESGISGLPGMPIDVSGRLGMGNLIPGTGLFLDKQSSARDVVEIVGPAGDLVQRGFAGAKEVLGGAINRDAGQMARGVTQWAPGAVRNAIKGAEMAATGEYKDTKGYKVINTTLDEALSKAIGFQPKSVADVQESNSFVQRSTSFYRQQSNEIKAQWAKALHEKDAAGVQRARDRLDEWNRKNPDQPMQVRMPDIYKRAAQMDLDRAERLAASAPKAIRQQVRDALDRG